MWWKQDRIPVQLKVLLPFPNWPATVTAFVTLDTSANKERFPCLSPEPFVFLGWSKNNSYLTNSFYLHLSMSYRYKAGQLPSWPFPQVILWRPSNGGSNHRRWFCRRCCQMTEVAAIFLSIEFVPVYITNDLAFQNPLKWTPKLHRYREETNHCPVLNKLLLFSLFHAVHT